MTCREVVDALGSYLDGDLAADVRLRLERHLPGCRACSDYLETYRRTVRLAKDASQPPQDSPPAEVPDDLVKAILARRRKG